MSKYTDEVLGHADESDGIEEYDNPLPDWWIGMFIVCVLWGVFYALDYHVMNDRSQAGFYDAEMVAAAAEWPQLNQKAAFDDSPETLALGQETYTTTCVSCHGPALGGGIGANLVDAEWIHGSDYESIVKTITEGVAAKGMPAWGPILGPEKVGALASFILSKGTGEAAAAPAEPTEAAPAEEAAADAAPADAADGDAVAAGGDDVGAKVFEANCVVCHMADMTGGIGPNLVDDEWIHGGELADITATVTNGVPAKGMVSWKGILDEAQIDAVAKYIFDKSRPE